MAADKSIFGLPPVLGEQPQILILGSMPSAKSIIHQQYYAHPQNAFWAIVSCLFGFNLADSYHVNVAALINNKVAVWDVLASCERKGSLDSAIVRGTEVLNPIASLLEDQPSIQTIGLNGGAAYTLFKRCNKELIDCDRIKTIKLPSSSPAHAAMRLEQKQLAWRQLLELQA